MIELFLWLIGAGIYFGANHRQVMELSWEGQATVLILWPFVLAVDVTNAFCERVKAYRKRRALGPTRHLCYLFGAGGDWAATCGFDIPRSTPEAVIQGIDRLLAEMLYAAHRSGAKGQSIDYLVRWSDEKKTELRPYAAREWPGRLADEEAKV